MSPEARFVINALVVLLVDVGSIVVCVLAWVKGRPAERFGALLYFLSTFGTLGVQFLTGKDLPVVPELACDAVVATGFLYLSLRYNNMWLGSAMIIKGLQLGLHATHLTDIEDPHIGPFNVYALSLDVISVIILSTLAGATFSSMAARRKAASPQLEHARQAA